MGATARARDALAIEHDFGGRQFAYIWRARVRDDVRASELGPHELAHAFDVNELIYGYDHPHCPALTQRYCDDRVCLNVEGGDPNADGRVGWHYLSDADSEYMQIRSKEDPPRYLP